MYPNAVIPFPHAQTKRHLETTRRREEYARADWVLQAQAHTVRLFRLLPGRRHLMFNGRPEEYLALLPPHLASWGLAAAEDCDSVFCSAQQSKCGRGVILLMVGSLGFEPDAVLLAQPEARARAIFEEMMAGDDDAAPVAQSTFLSGLTVARIQ
jgi:hypothetical protein